MNPKILEAVQRGMRSVTPEYWMRLVTRVIPAIVDAESDEVAREWVGYHIKQVQELYGENR